MSEDNTHRMIKFISNYSPYRANERALFPIKIAAKIVGQKVAVYDDDVVIEKIDIKKKVETEDGANAESDVINESKSAKTTKRAGKGNKSKKAGKGSKKGGRKRVRADG